MSDWNVITGEYDAETSLAIDEYLLEKASEEEEKYLRLYEFEQPAVILARNEHFDDVSKLREGVDYARRDTGGSVIYCDENAIFYSIAIPAGKNDYPENLHREYFGPRIAGALLDAGVEEDKLGVGEHFSVRIDGGTVSGNSQRKVNGAVLYHGVLAVDDWDVDTLDDLIELREKNNRSEKEFIEGLPSVSDHASNSRSLKEELSQLLIERFTGDDYQETSFSEEDWNRIREIKAEKYGNQEWLETAHGSESLQKEQGFCFVDWTDEWREDIDDFGFY